MILVGKEWNRWQSDLRNLITREKNDTKALTLCIEMHGKLHSSAVGSSEESTYFDMLTDGLTDEAFRYMSKDNTSIAWDIWHMTRIEDLVVNTLIAGKKQVFSENMQTKLNISITDTGNALTPDEVKTFSDTISLKALLSYRIAVGTQTRKILSCLDPETIKEKVKADRIGIIRDSGGVTDEEGSKWLLDFWARKTIGGLLLMPVTRHQVVHFNDAFRIKSKF